MNAETSKLDKLRSNPLAVPLYFIVVTAARFVMAGFWTVLLLCAVIVLLSDPQATTVGDVRQVLLMPHSYLVYILGGAAGIIFSGVFGPRGASRGMVSTPSNSKGSSV